MFSTILDILQLVLAILLIVFILLQQRGSGLGAAFGGSSNIYSSKRGVEKTLFNITIGLAVVFFIASFLNLVV